MAEITNELIYEVLKNTQSAVTGLRAEIGDLRTEMDTKFREVDTRFHEIDARFDKTDGKLDIFAEAIVKQGNQIEILSMAFNRQDARLERIEQHLGFDAAKH